MTEHAAATKLEPSQQRMQLASSAPSAKDKGNGLAYEMIEPTCLGDATAQRAKPALEAAGGERESASPGSAETSSLSGSNDGDDEGRETWSASTVADLAQKAAEFAEALAELRSDMLRTQEAEGLQRRASELGEELCMHFKQQTTRQTLDRSDLPSSDERGSFTISEKRWASVEQRIQKVLAFHELLEQENDALRAHCANLEQQLAAAEALRAQREQEYAALQQANIRLRWKVRDCEINVKNLLRKQHGLVEQVTQANTDIYQADQHVKQLQDRLGIDGIDDADSDMSRTDRPPSLLFSTGSSAALGALLAGIHKLLSVAIRWVSKLSKKQLPQNWTIFQVTMSFLGFVLLTSAMDRPTRS